MSDKPQPKETLLDEFKLALKARKLENGEKPPTLRVGLYENNPRLRVRTYVPGDKNNGYIDAAMNSHGFYSLMEMVDEIASLNHPARMGIGLDGHPFIQGQRSKEKLPVGVVMLERFEDGRITITVSAGNKRPVIPFDFMLDEYHHYKDGDGNAMPKALAYKISAKAWARMMRGFVQEALAITYAKPAWMQRNDQGNGQQRQGNGGYGNGQRQNNGYGGNQGGGYGGNNSQQSKSSGSDYDFDDDLPM